MGKTICFVLAAALMFVATSVVAQAVQLKAGEKELANGSNVRWQSSTFKAQMESPSGALACTSSEFEGEATKNQGETAEISVSKTTMTGCTFFGLATDVTTNAAEKPWKLRLQSANESGQFTAHLVPASGSTIQFNAKVQLFGATFATCDYTASTLQFMGEESSDVLHLEGSGQLTLQSASGAGAAECGKTGTVLGEAQLESGGTGVKAGGYTEICEVPEMPCPAEASFENNLTITGALEAKTSLTITPAGGNVLTCAASTIEKKYPLVKDAVPAITGEFVSLTFGTSCTEKNGTCTVSATTEPWVITLTPLGAANGAVKVTAGKNGDPTIGALCGLILCAYNAKSLNFTLVNNGKGKQSQMTAVKLPLTGTSGGGCPATAELSATWALTTPAKRNPGVD
jgi:hypothetical protein